MKHLFFIYLPMMRGLYIMDKMIVIPLNLFKLEQEIIIVDEVGSKTFAQVDLAHLPEVIVEACGINHTDTIRLIGNGNYAEALSNEIQEYAIKNYTNCKLKIDIMEV